MAERHFWASVFGSLDKASKAEATGNISLIQDAFRLSTLLNYFPLDADDEPQPPSRLLVENLPFFLSYRIPQVRGPQDVAFDDELEERIENWLCKPTANGQVPISPVFDTHTDERQNHEGVEYPSKTGKPASQDCKSRNNWADQASQGY